MRRAAKRRVLGSVRRAVGKIVYLLITVYPLGVLPPIRTAKALRLLCKVLTLDGGAAICLDREGRA